jgi:hypothetical protein
VEQRLSLCRVGEGREPEIGDLDVASGVDEDVVRLDVAVVHAKRVA